MMDNKLIITTIGITAAILLILAHANIYIIISIAILLIVLITSLIYINYYTSTWHSELKTLYSSPPVGRITNVPYLRNPNFIGRERLLEDLHNSLTSGKHFVIVAVIGLGGVGKTQLALEYSYRHMEDYKVIWWVQSGDRTILAANYASLSSSLNLPEKDDPEQEVIIKAVRNWLAQNGDWLLVFDNVQRPEDLVDYMPWTDTGHVIVTSRNQNWEGRADKILLVDVFHRDESTQFFRNRITLEDDAETLAAMLGDYPLALEQAVAYIEMTGISLASYLNLFQKRQKELLSHGKPAAYPDTVATTWDLSFREASEEVPISADLLKLCAFLAPDDIPRSILVYGSDYLPEPLASAVTDEMAMNNAIAALKRYSLLNVADNTLSVHRLVQTVTRDQLSDKERSLWAEIAVRLVSGSFPYDSDDVRTWPECAILLPHALAALEHAERLLVAPEATIRLLNQIGLYLRGRAEFNAARELFSRGLKIAEKVYGPDHPQVATRANNLGSVMQAMGDFEGAKELYERALKTDEKVYGPNHPEVATDVNNLGGVLNDIGDFEGAKVHFERALKIDEKVYGPDHPTVARDVNNLGGVMQVMGDLEGAKVHFEGALKIDEKVDGPDHPTVARDVNNLGGVLKAMGDFEGAKVHFERALRIDEKVYGPDHPTVARDVNNLGGVLKAMGDFEGAKVHFERALRIDEKVYGPDHPQVAIRINNLGSVMQAMGDFEGAKVHFERALNIFQDRLGEEHPKTRLVRTNLESLKRQR